MTWYLLCVELAAAAMVLTAFADADHRGAPLLRAVVIVVLAVAYTELSRRPATLRRFLHGAGPVWSDQTSVWTVAAVLVLPLWLAFAATLVIYGHLWLHTRKDRAEPLFRYAFSLSVTLFACGTTHLIGGLLPASVPSWAAQLALVGQVVVYTACALAIGVVSLRLRLPAGSTRPWRTVLPPRSSVALEAGALTAGLVLTVLSVHALVLTPLVLAVTALLQRTCLAEELARAATIDPKTGVLNARGWAAATQATTASHGTVLLVDIDRFKVVNDTYGHLVGDEVLVEVATRLQGQLRDDDTLARWGGEEFAVWLPGATAGPAHQVAERLRSAIATEPVATTRGPVQVTVSVGAATGSQDETADPHQLLAHADVAVYRAKDAGRNHIAVARR